MAFRSPKNSTAQDDPLTVSPVSTQDQISADLEDGVVATINGNGISEDAFKDWLMETKGRYYLNEYLDQLLIRQAAEQEGIVVSETAMDQAFEESWSRDVLYRFRGNEAAYLELLEQQGKSFEEHRREAMVKIEQDLLQRELIRIRRDPSDEDLKRLFVEEYGEDGTKRQIRIAFFDKFPFNNEPGSPRPTPQDLQQMAAESQTRANEFLAMVMQGTSFTEAVKKHSDDHRVTTSPTPMFNYREAGGEVPNVRRLMFGREVDDAIGGMTDPGFSGVIDSRRGLYVIELVEKKKVLFEEATQDLFATFLKKPPHAGEIFKLKEDLRREAKIARRF